MKKYILSLWVLLAACTTVPLPTAQKACELLDIASAEADLAPAWYRDAGEVLEACGVKDAKAVADERTCAAQKRNGYECREQK